jgi:hypothetical protein
MSEENPETREDENLAKKAEGNKPENEEEVEE